ncbi:MAG: hypothetical protein LQ352_004834 [Teloschistes flavicans]|nr:MAG: hypothetical protein LQ352_004834 [Teloschistes flavicans]
MPPKKTVTNPVTTIRGPAYSDGDAGHRPSKANYTRADEEVFMQKVAGRWMEQTGRAQEGRTYSLNKLPAGYELWERPRPSDPRHFDKWLYGHPNHKTFDSPYRFYPHFEFLMRGGHGTCTCDMCKKGKPSPRSSVSVPALPRGRPPLHKGPVDEEGTPDVFQSLFTLLKSERTLTRKIEERASMDWRAEKPLVDSIANSARPPSFVPRHGEIVLYLSPLTQGHELRQDNVSHEFKIFDTRTSRYTGAPRWLAGIVTERPSRTPHIKDLEPKGKNSSTTKNQSVNITGFRIEPLPAPGSKDKNISKQHTYTSLDLIRPFTFWKTCLHGIPEPLLPSLSSTVRSSRGIGHMRRYTPEASSSAPKATGSATWSVSYHNLPGPTPHHQNPQQ